MGCGSKNRKVGIALGIGVLAGVAVYVAVDAGLRGDMDKAVAPLIGVGAALVAVFAAGRGCGGCCLLKGRRAASPEAGSGGEGGASGGGGEGGFGEAERWDEAGGGRV